MDWNIFYPPEEPVIALPNWERPRLLISGRSVRRRWFDSTFYPPPPQSPRPANAPPLYAATGFTGPPRPATAGF